MKLTHHHVMNLVFRMISFLLCTTFVSCNLKKTPDVSNIDLTVKIKRFDRDLFSLKNEQDLKQLKKEHASFLALFSHKVIHLGDPNDEEYMNTLNHFLHDSIINRVAKKVEKTFPNLAHQELELEQAFKFFTFYFPNKKIPDIYAQISGFNQSVVVAENAIGISLDKYLGENCEFYPLLSIPKYARKSMSPEFISQDIVLAYALTEFPFAPKTDDLISNMIYQGKIKYLLMQLMPQKSEREIMKYTQEDWTWCKENEESIWGFMIENKHLFNTEHRTIIKYINNGPFTPGMPKESPSRTGIWIGLQIVKAFMNANKNYGLNELMKEHDYRMMLQSSSYQA